LLLFTYLLKNYVQECDEDGVVYVDVRPLELSDAPILFKYISNPKIMQFSRIKPNCVGEMMKSIHDLIVDEHNGKVIARAIVNQFNYPIGMIILWDVDNGEGFLATWLGEDYWGKGYNEPAKELFLDEIFNDCNIENVYVMIRNHNGRSLKALSKLDYVSDVDFRENVRLRATNSRIEDNHVLYVIRKDSFNITNRLLFM
jgi:RimJ/RimL family protein N-acetyltransferase